MAIVRVYNPVMLNPKRGTWTERQAATAKDRAERFERDVLEDDDAGDDFESMSIEEFAERHHKQIVRNPKRIGRNMKPTISRRKSGNGGNGIRRNQTTSSRVEADLLDQIDELKVAKKKLQSQVDEVQDILDCDDCSTDEHMDEIQAVLDGTGGGNGSGDDDSNDSN